MMLGDNAECSQFLWFKFRSFGRGRWSKLSHSIPKLRCAWGWRTSRSCGPIAPKVPVQRVVVPEPQLRSYVKVPFSVQSKHRPQRLDVQSPCAAARKPFFSAHILVAVARCLNGAASAPSATGIFACTHGHVLRCFSRRD